MAIYQDQLTQYLRGLGIADPNSIYGGTTGLLKPGAAPVDFLAGTKDGSTYRFGNLGTGSGSAFDKMPWFYRDQLDKISNAVGANVLNKMDDSGYWSGIPYKLGFNESTGNWEASTAGPGYDDSGVAMARTSPYQFEGFADQKALLDQKYSDIGQRWQIDPGLLSSTLRYWQDPNGDFNGAWINNVESIKYDPKYGLYLAPNSAGEYDVGANAAGQKGILESIFTDPIWLTTLSFGLGAALGPTAQAAGAAAPAGEAVAGATQSAGSWLGSGGGSLGLGIPETAGWWGAGTGVPATGIAAPASSGWWGGVPAFSDIAAGAAGGGGMWDWLDPSSWGDTSWLDNLNYGSDAINLADYGLDPNTFNWNDYIDYGNTTGNVTGPINQFGFPSTDISDILQYGFETGSLSNVMNALEDKLGLPKGTINTANKARSILGSVTGGSQSGVRSLLKSAGLSDGVADLLGTGLGLFGGYLQGNAATDAANKQAQATIEAARIAADASKFRPVGVTTRFGQSQFGYDANGNLVSAGYGLTPDIKAQQDKLLANSGGLLDQYLGAQSATAPLGTAAQRMFELGGGYLAANPQDQAAKFLSEQQALLAPSNERQLADLMNTLQQQGRMGLATGGTSTMAAANPALEAYYNAINQQNRQLAADATKGGMDYAKFGAGMFGLGGDTLKQMYGTQSEAFKPYSTSLGGATTIEGLGQNAMDIGASLGSSASAANAQGGRLLQQGMTDAARIQAPANAYSPWAGLLTGAGQSIQGYKFDPLTGRAL